MSSGEANVTRTTCICSAARGLLTTGALALACAAGAQNASTSGWACPDSISVEQRLLGPMPGWEPRNSEGISALEFVTVYDGHPSERASLVPDKEENRGGGRIAAIWTLGPSKYGYWLECAYRRTNVVIFRRPAQQVSKCEVVTDTRHLVNGRAEIVDVRCEYRDQNPGPHGAPTQGNSMKDESKR